MRAAIFLETGKELSLEDVTAIAPGPRDVIVHTDASGVCHSDQSLIERMPGGNPMIIGHEGCGTVEWVGSEVTRVRPGQRVLLRYDAYPYQKFGHYEGTVTSVSRATVSPGELAGLPAATEAGGLAADAGEPVYRVTVALDRQTANAYGAPAALQPGMTVQADVLIESRRVWEWVLDPLYALTGRAAA